MFGWYASLAALEQGFALVAVAATTVLFLQTGLQLFGFGMQAFSDSDASGLDDHDGSFADSDSDFDSDLDSDFDSDFGDIDAAEVDIPDTDLPEFDVPDSDFSAVELPDSDTPDIEISPEYELTSASGTDADTDAASGHDGHGDSTGPGLRLFTMRSMVAFFALAGWSGLIALQKQWSLPAVFCAAFVAGAIGSYTVAKILQIVLRLQDSGNVDLENAIGLEGEIYIRVPATGQGKGKVTLILQERFVELDAITRHDADLTPGSKVRIIGLDDEDTLIVRPIA